MQFFGSFHVVFQEISAIKNCKIDGWQKRQLAIQSL